jgi:hypothetical protein
MPRRRVAGPRARPELGQHYRRWTPREDERLRLLADVVDRTLAEPWARYAAENPGAKIIRALHNLRNIDRSSVDV